MGKDGSRIKSNQKIGKDLSGNSEVVSDFNFLSMDGKRSVLKSAKRTDLEEPRNCNSK